MCSTAIPPSPLILHPDAPRCMSRMACDQSEAIGANMKGTIHRRVCRKRLTGKRTEHTRRDASGAVVKRWTQKALSKSRVMQAFMSEAVRERILRDPGSAHLLQRKHVRLVRHGRASRAPVKEEGAAALEGGALSAAYKERVRELREEGGEPCAPRGA